MLELRALSLSGACQFCSRLPPFVPALAPAVRHDCVNGHVCYIINGFVIKGIPEYIRAQQREKA